MAQVKEVNESDVLVLEQLDVQIVHEPADSQPEVITDQDSTLNALPIALPEGLGQARQDPVLGIAALDRGLQLLFRELAVAGAQIDGAQHVARRSPA